MQNQPTERQVRKAPRRLGLRRNGRSIARKENPTQETEVSTMTPTEVTTFLSKQVSTWFVRSQNHFYDVDRINAALPQPHLQKICVQRIAQRFPELEITNEILKEVFQRVITETHTDPEQSIPIWDGTTRCCPGNQARVIREGEMVSINTWRVPEYRKLGLRDADSTWFDAFLERIFPHAIDRVVFKDWLSWCLQNEKAV